MDEVEYADRFLDPPEWVLDAAPEDDLPEEVRTAWQLAEAERMVEAERMPDPLTDPPGPGLAAAPAGQPDAGLGDGQLIDRITGLDRQVSWSAACQLRAIAELAKRRVADLGSAELGFFVDERALALTCTRYAAWARLHTALDLADRLPATLAALSAGRICPTRARVIAEGTRALTDKDAALVQDEVLGAAEVLTPAQLRGRVAAAAAAVDPRGADEAHEDACETRTVCKYPREHGMTGIWALLPADHAATVWAAVNTHAEATRQPDDGRTVDQRRADSLTHLMTAYLDGSCMADLPGAGSRSPSGPGGCPNPGVHRPPKVPSWCRVQVKVSADWLLGTSTEAPVLTGYGPLPADVALRLISDAGWQRIIYGPKTGALLDVGTTVHDPPRALREHVLVRDNGCTQPICGSPRVDLDHNEPFPYGPTSAGSLRSRCRHDHRLKQHPRWEARARPDGQIDWITPVFESLARFAHRPVRSSGRGRPYDAPGLSAAQHTYPEHIPDLRPGSTATLRSDQGIGPDPHSDPPPF